MTGRQWLLYLALKLPELYLAVITTGILGCLWAGFWLLFVPVLLLAALASLGFILNAPLPTPIARATGADRRDAAD